MSTHGVLLRWSSKWEHWVSRERKVWKRYNGALTVLRVEMRTQGLLSGSKDAQRIYCQIRKAHTQFLVKVGLNGAHRVSDHDEGRKATLRL
jgi:hypothetical protein